LKEKRGKKKVWTKGGTPAPSTEESNERLEAMEKELAERKRDMRIFSPEGKNPRREKARQRKKGNLKSRRAKAKWTVSNESFVPYFRTV